MKKLIIFLLCMPLLLSACKNAEPTDAETEQEKPIIVLDAGHGKPSGQMTNEEKAAAGYEYNAQRKAWGEWRHYKNGTFGVDCRGEDCTHNGDCFYPMVNGDRDIEPEINLQNALAAKKYLEEKGYEVRMTRTSNDEALSMNSRVSYCFPNNDITQSPDASLYVCIHSNAGDGRGTAYISLEGGYGQGYIAEDYITKSNEAGKIINGKIAEMTKLSSAPSIMGESYLVLFNKCPIPIAYLEIGYYDNNADLEILQTSSDEIGRAIAEGVAEWFNILR